MNAPSDSVGPGELEAAVLRCLWASDTPLNPRAVLGRLDRPLAYTTVMTILSRLWEKGLATRAKVGRAYEYTPTLDEAGYQAERMTEPLQRATDPQGALLRFVDKLTPRERNVLRNALDPDRATDR